MKHKRLGILLSILATELVGVAGYVGQNIPFRDQWPAFEALRTTAAIIFAVVGAWLAIIYPERLKFSFKNSYEGAKPKNQGISVLLTPAAHSTFILAIVLLVGVLAPIVKQAPFLVPFKPWLRGASYALVSLLTLWQVVTVISTLAPLDLLQGKVDEEGHRQRTKQTLLSSTQPRDGE